MNITILTDNPSSWFIPYGTALQTSLRAAGHDVRYVSNKQEIGNGDICFLLSCVRIVEEEYLARNRHNIVVHASDLPQGKGFAPLQWQILEGKHEIVLTLLEAVKAADAGPYYLKSSITFDGSELHDELRDKLGSKVADMCMDFVGRRDTLVPTPQQGQDSFYRRRTAPDDELDIHRSILEQFNHFRIADNERFPLYFRHLGHKYILKIYKDRTLPADVPSEQRGGVSEHGEGMRAGARDGQACEPTLRER
jgi:methionyl-tRNA formyltransferase